MFSPVIVRYCPPLSDPVDSLILSISANVWKTKGWPKVSILGVVALWGDCRDILTDQWS